MQIKEITYSTAEYQSLLNFRYLYLRKPLGLNWSHDDLLDESKQIHLGLINNKKIIGCCVLKILNSNTLKIRQMAIDKKYQKMGYGKKLIQYAENYAATKNYKKIIITARMGALDFYLRYGYQTEGKKFTDVTLESIKLIKDL